MEEYSGGAVFCLTPITPEELAAHQAKQRRWRADEINYRQRRLLICDEESDEEGDDHLDPFGVRDESPYP